MVITQKDIEKYEGCAPGSKAFSELYPNGVTPIQALQDGKFTDEQLFWAHQYFSLTDEEEAAYKQYFQIINSNNVIASRNVLESNAVCKSKNIQYSNRIYDSSNVSNSTEVHGCEDIVECRDMGKVAHANHSTEIFQSYNINYSNIVYNSSQVEFSNHIFSSNGITNCHHITNSTNIQDSMFCNFINDSVHCILCFGESNLEYSIFNQKVSRDEFLTIQSALQFAPGLQEQKFFSKGQRFSDFPICQYRDFNALATQEFIDWIKENVPNYDEVICAAIFHSTDLKFEKISKEEYNIDTSEEEKNSEN